MEKYKVLGEKYNLNMYGGKAKGLYYLDRIHMNIPETLIVPMDISIDDYKNEIENFLKAVCSIYGNDTKFVVRSSALNEDGEGKSWAGMYDTYLDISADKVFFTVKNAADYTKTERNQCYKKLASDEKNFDRISIVLQRMIMPEISGVCFTKNPVAVNSEEIVVEVVEGLGEKLVSGQITPQMYILDGKGNCLKYDCGEYESRELLTEKFLKYFNENINKIKGEICQDADIEFAYDGETLYFLQVRPITAVYKRVG